MKKMMLISLIFLVGCTTINVSITPPNGDGKTNVYITSDRNVNTNPSVTTRDVSAPIVP